MNYQSLSQALRYSLADRSSFERAIRENPLESTHHLVFADWLQEQGEEEEAKFRRSVGNWLKEQGGSHSMIPGYRKAAVGISLMGKEDLLDTLDSLYGRHQLHGNSHINDLRRAALHQSFQDFSINPGHLEHYPDAESVSGPPGDF